MNTLRTLRRSRSLTFLDLAHLTGISARHLAEIEYGLRTLAPQERDALATVLGLGPRDFTGAHRRPTAAQRRATVAPLPRLTARPEALIAAALAATLATQSLLAPTDAPPWRLNAPAAQAPAATQAPAQAPTVTSALAAGLLDTVAPEPVAAAAEALLAQARAILELRAALPEPAVSPDLLLATTPPETVAPAPLPTIEPAPAFILTDAGPLGCPVKPTTGRVVITQGYGVGTHAPAAIWGAVDLAVDGNGDGYADEAGSWYQPIVATHDGTVTVTLNSHPAGNHVWIADPTGVWRTGYSHLAIVTVVSGQFVRAGEQIGMLGSTGMSTGPHLDYQVWRNGVNLDPTGLVGC